MNGYPTVDGVRCPGKFLPAILTPLFFGFRRLSRALASFHNDSVVPSIALVKHRTYQVTEILSVRNPIGQIMRLRLRRSPSSLLD